MPVAPPDAAVSASVLHTEDENTDSCPAIFRRASVSLRSGAGLRERTAKAPAASQIPAKRQNRHPVFSAREQGFPVIRDRAWRKDSTRQHRCGENFDLDPVNVGLVRKNSSSRSQHSLLTRKCHS